MRLLSFSRKNKTKISIKYRTRNIDLVESEIRIKFTLIPIQDEKEE